MSTLRHIDGSSPQPQPAWDIAKLFPDQGSWSEEDFLELDAQRTEFTDGVVEVLPVPTTKHHRILFLLCRMLHDFAAPDRIGEVLPAGVKIRLRTGKLREPDVVFMLTEHADRITNPFWIGADLVIEVVSPDDPARDYEKKRIDYAEANVPEYWIVDPQTERILVLTLPAGGAAYTVHGEFAAGASATSRLLAGFKVDVTKVFAAGRGER